MAHPPMRVFSFDPRAIVFDTLFMSNEYAFFVCVQVSKTATVRTIAMKTRDAGERMIEDFRLAGMIAWGYTEFKF